MQRDLPRLEEREALRIEVAEQFHEIGREVLDVHSSRPCPAPVERVHHLVRVGGVVDLKLLEEVRGLGPAH